MEDSLGEVMAYLTTLFDYGVNALMYFLHHIKEFLVEALVKRFVRWALDLIGKLVLGLTDKLLGRLVHQYAVVPLMLEMDRKAREFIKTFAVVSLCLAFFGLVLFGVGKTSALSRL